MSDASDRRNEVQTTKSMNGEKPNVSDSFTTDNISSNTIPSAFESASHLKHNDNHSPYENLVRRLYMTNLFNPVKLGLQNTIDLHDALGSPMNNSNITIIHIAGTNGKGSVAMKTAKTFEIAGHTTGLFVSPHVSSFRERMSVNGVPISEEEVELLLPRVFEACEIHSIPATFFEITTVLAFLFYVERKVDAVVLETGLGGRLDATNIIQNPALTIITSIGLEHTRILGDTIEEIALEKGGIIKKSRPVLVGPETPHDVLRECAREKGASSFQTCNDVLGEDVSIETSSSNELSVKDYDQENSRIVRAAFHILEECKNNASNATIDNISGPSWKYFRPITEDHLQKGTSIRPPCRFETVEVAVNSMGSITKKTISAVKGEKKGDEIMATVVLDVAHNPPAMVHLASKLIESFPNSPKRFVAGFSSDKDLRLCTKTLIDACDGDMKRIHLIEAAHPRAATLEAIQTAVPELRDGANWDIKDRSITAQLKHALQLAVINNEILVVCGSVFIMAEAREALGFDEPRDSGYISEVAGTNLRHGQENFGNMNPLLVKK